MVAARGVAHRFDVDVDRPGVFSLVVFERYFSRTTVPVVHDAPGVTETRVWFELRALYSSESEVSV